MKFFLYLAFLGLYPCTSFAQTILRADGPGETYELINSVLAPGNNAVEPPDCSHESFGRHIDEIFDETLNLNVFRFFIHTTPDDDRCIKFDRQRNEIKTYSQSPDSLLAVQDELVEYKWLFKIDSEFQPSSSFTHLHQIKAVGGSEDAMPLITLTARKGTPDKLELRYAANLTQSTLKEIDLSPLKGEWLSVTETMLVGELITGEYEIVISKVSDGSVVFEYANPNIRMWKTDADFLRPKWGIYRSLNDANSLRDEEVLFAEIQIDELNDMVLASNSALISDVPVYLTPNPFNNLLRIKAESRLNYNHIYIYNDTGSLVLSEQISSDSLDVSFLEAGLYFVLLRGKNSSPYIVKMVKED